MRTLHLFKPWRCLLVLALLQGCVQEQVVLPEASGKFTSVVSGTPGFYLAATDTLFWDGELIRLTAVKRPQLQPLISNTISESLRQRGIKLGDSAAAADYKLLAAVADGETDIPQQVRDLIGLSAGLVSADENTETGVLILAIVNASADINRNTIFWRAETEAAFASEPDAVDQQRIEYLISRLIDEIPVK